MLAEENRIMISGGGRRGSTNFTAAFPPALLIPLPPPINNINSAPATPALATPTAPGINGGLPIVNATATRTACSLAWLKEFLTRLKLKLST
ncbi:hypothetical protein MVEN_01062800 [Mycena venus]|uniref:Uncharacterized protein n=1 Tax=Mycena venus TaxID=2733690 RepID=A0A8H6Y7C4_9AGAR|nr:hypothetical protein MVEN_01062800 [Mycena venus]